LFYYNFAVFLKNAQAEKLGRFYWFLIMEEF